MNTENGESAKTSKYNNTGWAILFAVIASLFFFVIYRLLFSFFVSAYAQYDPGFASGFGALILLVVGANVLGCLSGAVVARRIFRRANGNGMFYGLSTLLVAVGSIHFLQEMSRHDTNWFLVLVNIVTIAISIYVLRLVLLVDQE